MCGIHLILDKESKLRREAVARMVEATSHRGPDANGVQFVRTPRQFLSLGHNRLKITDLRDSANQPMQTPDGRYWLLFNGAIYNFRGLRGRLRHQYAFQTESDTEVLLYWLSETGSAGLTELDGMYALAFYDCHTEQLLLARDQWGMKPLYYAENEKHLIVSSEIRGILASGLVEKELEPGQVDHYLRFKFARRPGTFYKGIFELEPGAEYVSKPEKRLALIAPFTGRKEPTGAEVSTGQYVVEQLSLTLTEVVARHLEADVPAGLFLSGGVDSTLLLALSREAGVKGLPVFTVAYAREDEVYATRDQHFARLAARQYEAQYHEVTLNRQLLDRFWQWLPSLDQPIGDGAAWLTWVLAQEAQKHVKVVLSGAGADELFGGYNRHWAFYQYLKKYHWLKYTVPLLQRTAAALPNYVPLQHWHKLGSQFRAQPRETFINFTAHLPHSLVKEGQGLYQPELFCEIPEWHLQPDGSSRSEFIEENLLGALRYDQTHYLPADVLALTDRMTMQHGIEARLPYLGHQVTQLAGALPAAFRLERGRKWLLKEALLQRDGAPFVRRRKEGFGMPFGHWLCTPVGRPMVELLRNQESAIFDVLLYKGVQEMLQGHLSRKRDYSSELWTLLVLAGWTEQEFGKGNREGSNYCTFSQMATGSPKR